MGPTRKDTRNLCVFSWNSLQVSVPVFQAYERDIKPVWLANSYRHASHIFIYPASETISIKIFFQRFIFKGILFKTKTLCKATRSRKAKVVELRTCLAQNLWKRIMPWKKSILETIGRVTVCPEPMWNQFAITPFSGERLVNFQQLALTSRITFARHFPALTPCIHLLTLP